MQNKTLSEDSINTVLISGVTFLMMAAILTQFQKEDAFIYFRTARNLAMHGEYSFNLGENYPGATSYFYALLLSANYYIFAQFSLLTIQLMNCSMVMFSAILLAKFSYGITEGNNSAKQLTFWIVGTSSPLIVAGTAGLETAFLIFAISLMLYSALYDKKFVLLLATGLLPLLRIETSIAPVLLIALGFFSKNKIWSYYSLAGVSLGTVLFFCGNHFLTGNILPQTITAKSISYQTSKEILDVLKRFIDIWFGQNYLLGIPSRFMTNIIPPLVGIIFTSVCLVTAHSALKKYNQKTKLQKKSSLLLILVIFSILSLVVGYCVGGVTFSWYFLPSGVLLYYLLSHCLVLYAFKTSIVKSVIAVLSLFTLLNLISLTNTGYKFNTYFAEIGRIIANQSKADDTLFLEPAGFIPYFASIHTWDTVGLVSPEALIYRKQYGSSWWIELVKEKQPTWIIERQPIHTLDHSKGIFEYQLSVLERDFFNNTYSLNNHFSYEKFRSERQELFSVIYNFGNTEDFYLYKKRF